MKKISKAERIGEFLKFVDECRDEYELAFEEVGKEDRRLQDLLHEMEFSPDRAARNRNATRLHDSRVHRRENKNLVQMNEEIVKFFSDRQNRAVLDKMRQLLRQQRKREEYLNGERTYTPRVEKEITAKAGAGKEEKRQNGG